MLEPTLAERIRAIFLHDGGPVTIFDFVILLGWDAATFEAAVKWRVVTVESSPPDVPRVSHAQLVERARDEWTDAEIVEALGPDAHRLLDAARRGEPAAARRPLHSVRCGALVAARRSLAARRRRPDGIREATFAATLTGYRTAVPYLRLRGHWLAQLGFAPETRVYIAAEQGRLVITVTDPAAPAAAAPPALAVVRAAAGTSR